MKKFIIFQRGLSGGNLLYIEPVSIRWATFLTGFAFHFAIGYGGTPIKACYAPCGRGGKSAAQVLSRYGAFGFGKTVCTIGYDPQCKNDTPPDNPREEVCFGRSMFLSLVAIVRRRDRRHVFLGGWSAG